MLWRQKRGCWVNSKKTILLILVAGVAVTLILTFPEMALARAGGGGRGGGWINLVFWPVILIYSAILTHLVRKKSEESKALLARLNAVDSTWDLNKIKKRIEIAFFKIQDAWMQRDQNLAKEYMSERLYHKHKLQTDQMIAANRQNILEGIDLIEAEIVQIADFKDDSQDSIWVYIKGSMIDYIVNSQTREVISGDEVRTSRFKELWKLIRNADNDWVVDEIDQEADISDVRSMRSFSEELEHEVDSSQKYSKLSN